MIKIIPFIITAVSYLVAVYFYPQMPDTIITHWNELGQSNGYMDKFWGMFFIPFLSSTLLVIFQIVPVIDPLKKNIQSFRTYFDKFVALIFIFLLYIYLLTIYQNLGYAFNMIVALIPAFAVLFYGTGILLEKVKRNWFMGIRTPWTLSNDVVWEKTHKLGSKLFKIVAVLSLAGLVFQTFAFYILIGPIILVSLFLVLYSYLVYRNNG